MNNDKHENAPAPDSPAPDQPAQEKSAGSVLPAYMTAGADGPDEANAPRQTQTPHMQTPQAQSAHSQAPDAPGAVRQADGEPTPDAEAFAAARAAESAGGPVTLGQALEAERAPVMAVAPDGTASPAQGHTGPVYENYANPPAPPATEAQGQAPGWQAAPGDAAQSAPYDAPHGGPAQGGAPYSASNAASDAGAYAGSHTDSGAGAHDARADAQTGETASSGSRLDSPAWSYTAREAPAAEPAPEPAPAPKAPAGRGLFGRKSAAKSAPKSAAKAAGPKTSAPPFASTHPLLKVEQGLPPSAGSRIFSALALVPILPLTLMLLLQTVFSLDARALWHPEEIHNAAGLSAMIAANGFAPLLNGAAETAAPLYFWFLRGLAFVLPTEGPMLHLTAAALSGLLFLWAVLGLGRNAARFDGRGNLAAGILLLGTGVFMGLSHYGSDVLLFAALVTASHIFLYRSLVCPRAQAGGMAAAFLLAAAAALIKGPAGLALPLASTLFFVLWRASRRQWLCVAISAAALAWGLACAWSALPLAKTLGLLPTDTELLPELWLAGLLGLPALCLLALALISKGLRVCAALSLLLLAAAFVLAGGLPGVPVLPCALAVPLLAILLLIVWQATPQRLFRADLFIGLAAALLGLGLAFALLTWDSFSLESLQARFLNLESLAHLAGSLSKGAPPAALLCALIFFLPWTLLLLCLPWQRIAAKSTRAALAASRTPEKEGLAFLWCMALAAPAVALVAHDSVFDLFAAALAPLSLLFGRAALGLEGRQAPLFKYAMAAFCLAGGLLTIFGALMLFDVLPMPGFPGLPAWTLPTQGGFFVAGGVLLVIGALLWMGLSSARPEGVLLLSALAATALGYPLGGMIMPAFDSVLSPKDQALLIRAYADKGYAVTALNVPGGMYEFYAAKSVPHIKPDELQALADKGNMALAAPLASWEGLTDKPGCLQEVQRQWIGSAQYLLLACPPVEGLAPAPLPYRKGPDLLEEARKHLDLPLPAPAEEPAAQPEAAAPAEEPASPEAASPDVAPDAAAPEEEPAAQPEAAAPAEEPAAPEAAAPDAAPETAAPVEEPAPQPEAAAPAEEPASPEAASPDAAPETAAPVEEPAPQPEAAAPAEEPAAPEAAAPDAAPDAAAPAEKPAAQPEAAAPAEEPASPEAASPDAAPDAAAPAEKPAAQPEAAAPVEEPAPQPEAAAPAEEPAAPEAASPDAAPDAAPAEKPAAQSEAASPAEEPASPEAASPDAAPETAAPVEEPAPQPEAAAPAE